MTKPPQYTAEVLAALKAQTPPPDEPPPVPAGHIRYFVAVDTAQQSGTAPPRVVAALLRAQADQLDPTKPITRTKE